MGFGWVNGFERQFLRCPRNIHSKVQMTDYAFSFKLSPVNLSWRYGRDTKIQIYYNCTIIDVFYAILMWCDMVAI